jgi:L-lysine 6-transaminase
MLAFDLPSHEQRDAFHAGLFELGLLALRCGERSIRFRPVLDISMAECQEALALLREQCRRTRSSVRPAECGLRKEALIASATSGQDGGLKS